MPAPGVATRMPTRAPGEAPKITNAMIKAGADVIRSGRAASKVPSDIARDVYRVMDAERRKGEADDAS